MITCTRKVWLNSRDVLRGESSPTGSANLLVVALGSVVYMWNADTSSIKELYSPECLCLDMRMKERYICEIYTYTTHFLNCFIKMIATYKSHLLFLVRPVYDLL